MDFNVRTLKEIPTSGISVRIYSTHLNSEAVESETDSAKNHRMVDEVGGHKSCFNPLPVEETLHDLEDPKCPHCHSQLKELRTVEKSGQ